MGIQYAGGTIIEATLTQSTGTRAELADLIEAQLVNAGWTLISSSGSDYKLNSAVTPSSLQARVRVYDPGSGNCTRLKFSNVSETHIQSGDIFLLPAASKSWKFIANKYQFWIYTLAATAAREFGAGGTIYVPPSQAITEAVWGLGNAENDTSVTVRQSLRTKLSGQNNATPPNQFGLINGSVVEANGTASVNTQGVIQVAARWSTGPGSNQPAYRWFDGSLMVNEAVCGWTLSASVSNEARWHGQFWDAIVIPKTDWIDDQTITYDGRTYRAITRVNAGGSTDAPGALFVAVT